jgi:endoglycosylceramidase
LGRSKIFHGVNIVYKVSPYIPSSDKFDPELSLTDDELDNLVKWGFNFVRLGVMWEAVERSHGTFN